MRQRIAKVDGFGLAIPLPQKLALEKIEPGKLVLFAELGVIGDVIRGPDEIVER